jgi:MoxR-like ATPase
MFLTLEETVFNEFMQFAKNNGCDDNDIVVQNVSTDTATVFVDGPVITAMRKGCVLLADEIDLGTNKLMCLQSILEGSGYFNKKTGEYIKPAPGFNIIATANTKGRGDETGKFIGTGIMNEAFLERFPVTMFQEYPTPAVETKIMGTLAKSLGMEGDRVNTFIDNLVKWAAGIRKTFDDGGIEEVITTRRLTNILKAFQIFQKEQTAVTMCVARFDNDTAKSFTELFQKIAGVNEATETQAAPADFEEETSPF